jgi:hypothetical protein
MNFYHLKGDDKQASLWLEEAVMQCPDDPEAFVVLGQRSFTRAYGANSPRSSIEHCKDRKNYLSRHKSVRRSATGSRKSSAQGINSSAIAARNLAASAGFVLDQGNGCVALLNSVQDLSNITASAP